MLLLAGRSWTVTHVDWTRRRCLVEPADSGGRAKWSGLGRGVSFEIARGMRAVLFGDDPAGVSLTRRGAAALAGLRVDQMSTAVVSPRWRQPEVDRNAVAGLKFSAALPPCRRDWRSGPWRSDWATRTTRGWWRGSGGCCGRRSDKLSSPVMRAGILERSGYSER